MVSAIETVLIALNQANVRYIIVGGVAVVLHGHLRTTADLDLVVKLDHDNALRTVHALSALGYHPRAPVPAEQFADPEARADWARDKGMTVFSMWSERSPGLEVDLFVSEPFDFDAAYARAVTVELDTTTATVASLSDLMTLKRAAGRAIDLADLEALAALEPTEEGKD